jgi:hypothetical protein
MKNLMIILMSLLSYTFINTQVNLVQNPSFEEYSSCPFYQGQIEYATGWYNFGYTPDYFNTCSTNSNFSTPYNMCGYQNPATGNAYAGIYTYSTPQPPIDINIREFIGTELSSSLSIGTKYFVSFKVALAIDQNQRFNHASNKIGLLFTNNFYSIDNPLTITNFAHIYEDDIITDTTNWTIISGSFVADSAYRYAVIGNFFDDFQTSISQIQDTISDKSAYYLIDDVTISTDSLSALENHKKFSFMKIYPNPTFSKNITIETTLEINSFKLYITDLYGNEIKYIDILANKTQINLENLNQGVYFIVFKDKEKFYKEKLIIIN